MAADNKAIRAVRKVLYEPRRLRKLFDHLSSIDVLMNLDRTQPLQPGDIRVEAGSGPNWFFWDSGEVDGGVLEASDRCDRVAELLLETRRELAQVKFDPSDKQHLRAALAEQAQAWQARAAAWRAPGPPDVQAAVGPIAAHEQASLRAFQRVKKYLKNVNLTGP
jgi:hypothetical protein